MPTRPAHRCRCKALIPAGKVRCDGCEAVRNASREHYRGDYDVRAATVRAATSECWLCLEGERVSDPWQADHEDAGNPASPLFGAHRSCNARRGGRTAVRGMFVTA